MPTMAERYELLRSMGKSEREARIQALVNDIRATEGTRIAAGEDYPDTRVRMATVHTRDDVVLLCAQLGEVLRVGDQQTALLRQVRWALVALVLLTLLRVTF